ncbi:MULTISPECIES: winged helix DNA-binding domain-containing protein [Actinomadura]|uniref:Winged helix DNA-binding domain-containing protein n=1 Tax=Actinomadura litoris TaxID=2678616 RepID=A0A7K1L4Y8_9ACTN|nr:MULTISPECIES: winged helix DNA-binding domain-containing protein [Actinomadura]MBT2209856.1 winged helix DNA-binding domain-containing protein [Actinomadura sp. NEAU-AAG7]MUN39316.1 winged helix DNA-binding domain-containing protein [Actinomadura litoris]
MRSMTIAERRARLARRHRLAPADRTDDPAAIARSLVVLHATDPATVFLSVAARSARAVPADVERALYDDRSLLRMLAMRRTMFVAPVELVPILQASTAEALADKQRRTYTRFVEKAGVVEDADAFFRDVAESAHRALLARGEATGAQLGADEPRLRTQIDPAPGKSYSKPTSITTWVLVTLGCEGRIVRGRPNGTWISSQYRWSPVEAWLPGGIPSVPADEAAAALVERWLRAFGPAPLSDLRWWTGWSATAVRKALAPLDVAEVDLGGTTGLVLADDLEPAAPAEPWAALLPALDPTPMGWQERGWFLGGHGPSLFDRNGNIGPSLWWDGRIVGGWAQRADGEIVLRFLEDAGADARAAAEREAERMAAWYGGIRAVPRFRTPLERELTA